MTTCTPCSTRNPFVFRCEVNNNISATLPLSETGDSIVKAVASLVPYISNRNNCFHKTYNSIKSGFDFAIQVMNAKYEVTAVCGDSNVDRLDEIGKLRYDWNGYGAQGFSETLIETCKKLFHLLPVAPKIYPTGRQSIQFQYELIDKSYLEFEIFEEKIICLQVPQRKYSEARVVELRVFETERVKEIVGDFYGQGRSEK